MTANHWNPNVVAPVELKLLERSLLKTGWIQPILVNRDGIIIDGFHRYTLTLRSEAVKKRWGGKVPCAVLDVGADEAMMITIRINRAKGTHVAVAMSSIVKALIDEHHCDPMEVAAEIGATKQEIDLLYQDGIFKHRDLANKPYSKAWVPVDK